MIFFRIVMDNSSNYLKVLSVRNLKGKNKLWQNIDEPSMLKLHHCLQLEMPCSKSYIDHQAEYFTVYTVF